MPRLMLALVLATLTAATGAAVALQPTDAERAVRERLPELTAFVERERGLELRRPVQVTVLPEQEFLDALREGGEALQGQDAGATSSALGLVDPETYEEDVAALDGDVVGYYDSLTEELVVRERPADAYLDLVLVHELVHAVQDQWFGIDRPTLWDHPEQSLAFDALVEGDAVRVENAYYAGLSVADQRLVDEEDGPLPEDPAAAGQPDEPFVLDPLTADLELAYYGGLLLVEALLDEGGQERLDRAFRQPPISTEQVLHPELVGTGSPLEPPLPQRDGELVDSGVLGELGLAVLLGTDPWEAGGAQQGWAGDAYATYDRAGRTCTAAAVLMDDTAARDRLVAALADVAVEARPTGPTALELESCG